MTREITASKKQDWGSPRPFFATLNEEYGFTVDVCAAWYNALLPRYFGPGSPIAEDGLRVSWCGEVTFCNPPYEDIESWLRKGLLSAAEGGKSVFLIPANTDTRWFHQYAVVGQVDFIKGRLSFEDLTPPDLELRRLWALYQTKPAPNLFKQIAVLFRELVGPDMVVTHEKRMQKLGGGQSVEAHLEAASVALKHFPAWKTLSDRKPGPGFPSMVVTFDPNAPAGSKPFRTREKTGRLIA